MNIFFISLFINFFNSEFLWIVMFFLIDAALGSVR